MKKILTAVLLGMTASSFSYANQQSSAQINLIKKLYTDRINKQQSGMEVIKKHSSTDLRQWIIKTDAIADANAGDMCDWVYDPMIPGQDFDTRLNQLKYTTLSNGRVRVQGQNFGEKFQIDYELQCDNKGCKINDLFDPKSYKQLLKSAAQKKLC